MQRSEDLLEQVKNYMPHSTAGQIESFMEGSIHLDFQNEILARIEDMRDYNEECGSKEYLETRGGIKAMRLLLTMFADLMHNAAEKETGGESDV